VYLRTQSTADTSSLALFSDNLSVVRLVLGFISFVNKISFAVVIMGHNFKMAHFKILACGKTDFHCKMKKPCLYMNLSQP